MGYRLLVVAVLAAGLSGCALFNDDAPRAPQLEGHTAQVEAWRDAIRRDPDGGAPTFVPLADARKAVAAAKAQERVNEFGADALSRAEASLAEAQSGWDKIAKNDKRSAKALSAVADAAHDAERQAQVAQYTAQRELGLNQLNALQASRGVSTGPGAAADTGQLSDDELINERVVPTMLGSLQFQEGSARLTDDSREVIGRLVDLLAAHPDLGVAVFGFTDNAEPADQRLQAFINANPKLAQQDLSHAQQVAAYRQGLTDARARDVAQLLVQAGTDPDRIGARGMRNQHPIASNDTPAGRRKNERAEAIMVPLEAIQAGRGGQQ
tara:strand:+ start:543 stop:1514 length:972 start_codon:yes stop_codon:yes gene_type:complete